MKGFETLVIGTELPELTLPPITRAILQRYARASGDNNPIHLDLNAAKSAGLDDVIAHGMLVMAYAGRAITDRFPLYQLRAFQSRFVGLTRLGDILRASGKVIDLSDREHATVVCCEVKVTNAREELVLVAEATLHESHR